MPITSVEKFQNFGQLSTKIILRKANFEVKMWKKDLDNEFIKMS